MFATNGEVLENRPQVATNLTLNLPIYLTSKQTEVIFNSVVNLPADTHSGSNLCPVSLFYFSRKASTSWPVGHILASLTSAPNADARLNTLKCFFPHCMWRCVWPSG